MNVIELLREQFKNVHDTQEATMADVTPDVAHFGKVNKALPVGAAYAHSVAGEDYILSTMVAHKAPICADNSVTGMSIPMPSMAEWDQHEQWVRTLELDLPKFRTYAQSVYKATDDFLATLKEEDLMKELDLGSMGKHTVLFVINNFLLLHVANLTGEMSAAKGFQGKKGYPF